MFLYEALSISPSHLAVFPVGTGMGLTLVASAYFVASCS